jgi:MFS family permease
MDPLADRGPAAPAASGTPGPGDDGPYRWYLAGCGSWFGGVGMQQVLLPWLVVGELGAGAEWAGTVQMTVMLPSVALLLIGGAVADRVDPKRMLVWLHLLGALPPLVLAVTTALGLLSLPILIACAAGIGIVSAISFPARDSLLARVSSGNLMRAVTGMTIAQFGAQGVGMALAGAARWLGSPLALGIQGLCVALGAGTLAGVPARAAPSTQQKAAPPSASELFVGLRLVMRSELRLVLVMVCGIGLLFSGSYHVVLPIAVRDIYGGDVQQVSILLMMFPLGTILGSFLILARGGIRRKGRALLLALTAAALAIVISGVGLPFPGLVLATLAWGLGGSVFMNTSRTLFQERAPEAERGRVLAVQTLGFAGSGPVGALLAGLVAARFGPLAAMTAFGVGMLLLVVLVAATSNLRRLE